MTSHPKTPVPTDAVPTTLLAPLVEHARPVLALDRSGRCRFANAAAAALAAAPDEPLAGAIAADRIPLLAERRVANLIAGARTGLEGQVEVMAPGRARSFVVRAVPADDVVLLYLEETSERRAAEAAAAQAVEQARLSGLAGVTGSYESDLVGGTIWLSEQARRIVGFEPSADSVYPREAITDAIVPEDRAHQAAAVAAAAANPGGVYDVTYRVRHPDGAVRRLHAVGEVLGDAEGRPRTMVGSVSDITDRAAAEAALHRSEERLRRTVEGVDAIITYLEEGGAPTIQSPQVERLLGYPPEALETEEAWFALIHPDDLPRCLAVWQSRTPSWLLTYRMRRADGTWMWVDDRGHRFDHDDGRAPGYVGVVVDATERVAAGQERRIADQRRQRFFDANIVGTLVAESRGRVLEANDYWLRLVGRTREDLERGELDWRAMTMPESLPEDDDAIEQCRATGTSRPYEKAYRRPDGTAVAALVVRAAMPGPEEQFAAFVLDLTERNAAATEVARLIAAIEQTSESVVVTGLDAAIEYVNPAFERASGYTRDEVIGQNPRILQSGVHGAEFYAQMWDTLGRGDTWRGELVNRRKDGTTYTEVAAISPIRDGVGRVTAYVGVKRDVTAERELQARLAQSERLDAIGHLAGGIAHDFNNLLAVIRGYADLARAALPSASPATEDLDQVVLAADRASSLTRQLLLFSRRQPAEPVVLDMGSVVEGLAPMLRRLLGEHIELDVVAVPPVGAVLADASQLEQVVLNLAANARDAMPDGGRLVLRTETAREDDSEWVRLTVSDTGVGMDESTAEHVFVPFFTTKAPGRGTGLGLSTVYGIVTQAGGRIRVASALAQGTTFVLDLPRVDLPAQAPAAAAPAVRAGRRRPLTVLLVEDDAAVRSLTRRMLASLGHTVSAASSGAEALGLIEVADRLPDLLLTDVRMPGIQGPELARRLRERRPDLPVVFSSGFSAELGDTVEIPGAQVLDKPFDVDRLEAAIRAAVGDER